jgi:hypothetical protein
VLPANIVAQIDPSMDVTSQEVYRTFSAAVFQSTGVLLLSSGQIALANGRPSWTLDVACPPSDLVHPLTRTPSFCANAATTISPEFLDDAILMTCKGYFIDMIGAVASPNTTVIQSRMSQEYARIADWQHDTCADPVDLLWFTLLTGRTFDHGSLYEMLECLRTMPWPLTTNFERFLEQGWLYNHDGSLGRSFREIQILLRAAPPHHSLTSWPQSRY